MLKSFSNRIVESLCEGGLVPQEDKQIYFVGVEIALLKFIHILTMLLIGLYFGMLLETTVFIICYSGLRVYAGGYHAKTKTGCYCISWFMILFFISLIKLFPIEIIIPFSVCAYILSYLIIYFLAPVGSVNKPLDRIEIQHYRKIVRVILLAEAIISIVLLFVKDFQILFIMSLSLVSVSIILIIGKIQISKLA